ncbi:MAG: N-acetylmuramoyl-L-alanine amidase, partial [Oscillospiraceae bacterium]|nr:N-acetylmuramoyl-L-alanine amidase [Oscillospiraceae bacterium]
MSNSALVSHTKISPNKTSPRTHAIDTITIHHMAGNLSVESCCAGFAKSSRQASANYCIGSDGRIGLCVDEGDRSWCSSSRENDHRAITIEVANSKAAEPWPV